MAEKQAVCPNAVLCVSYGMPVICTSENGSGFYRGYALSFAELFFERSKEKFQMSENIIAEIN